MAERMPKEEWLRLALERATNFWPKVDKNGPTVREDLGPCWLWTKRKNADGYGEFVAYTGKKRNALRAHRVAWTLTHGPIPDGLELDHLCKVRHCVNPAHLEPVTHAENVRRGASAAANLAKTHCPKGHPYDETNTSIRRRANGRTYRMCKACQDAATEKWREANREAYLAKCRENNAKRPKRVRTDKDRAADRARWPERKRRKAAA